MNFKIAAMNTIFFERRILAMPGRAADVKLVEDDISNHLVGSASCAHAAWLEEKLRFDSGIE